MINESETLEFGGFKTWMVEEYSPGVGTMNKPYVLYDGNTAIAITSKFMRRPKFRGICNETEISDITDEIGNKQTLWVRPNENDILEFPNAAIINVDVDYWKHAEGMNYYKFTLTFAVEGGT